MHSLWGRGEKEVDQKSWSLHSRQKQDYGSLRWGASLGPISSCLVFPCPRLPLPSRSLRTFPDLACFSICPLRDPISHTLDAAWSYSGEGPLCTLCHNAPFPVHSFELLETRTLNVTCRGPIFPKYAAHAQPLLFWGLLIFLELFASLVNSLIKWTSWLIFTEDYRTFSEVTEPKILSVSMSKPRLKH